MLRFFRLDSKTRFAAIFFSVVLFYYVYSTVHSTGMFEGLGNDFSGTACDFTPSLSEILVMVKTGACEDPNRLYVQSQTSLRCVPSSSRLYFSDLEQEIGRIHLQDTLMGSVDQKYIDSDDEFVLYKKLQELGSCKDIEEEDKRAATSSPGLNGNNDNRGWTLDKWKHLPMAEISYTLHNAAKWYFALEPDTYVVWRNLIQFLDMLDHEREYYIGSPMSIREEVFIYGGSGTILSQAAMRKVVEHIREDSTALQEFVHGAWAGDHVVAKALSDVGINHTKMSREFVRDSPMGADYSFHWCTAALTFHHVLSEEAAAFSAFENGWFAKNPGSILRHKDIFQEYILPHLDGLTAQEDWDNNARDEITDYRHNPSNIDECKRICIAHADCVQYRFVDGNCYSSNLPQVGRSASQQQSGWLAERVKNWSSQHAPCTPEQEAWSAHD